MRIEIGDVGTYALTQNTFRLMIASSFISTKQRINSIVLDYLNAEL